MPAPWLELELEADAAAKLLAAAPFAFAAEAARHSTPWSDANRRVMVSLRMVFSACNWCPIDVTDADGAEAPPPVTADVAAMGGMRQGQMNE